MVGAAAKVFGNETCLKLLLSLMSHVEFSTSRHRHRHLLVHLKQPNMALLNHNLPDALSIRLAFLLARSIQGNRFEIKGGTHCGLPPISN